MTPSHRTVPLDMGPDQFRTLGHELVDRIAAHLATLPGRPVTLGDSPTLIRDRLGQGPLAASGGDPAEILDQVTRLLVEHSLFNGHPRFWGYITSSPAPLGILGDLLAAAMNPNVGAFVLSPVATEIERQACGGSRN